MIGKTQFESSGKIKVHVGAGYILFTEFTPKWPDTFSSGGGIVLPQSVADGSKTYSKVVWGRAYRSGVMANRTSCEPFNSEIQDGEKFPLAEGTWLCFRAANVWTLNGNLLALNTSDLVAIWPAERTWESIVREIFDARIKLSGE